LRTTKDCAGTEASSGRLPADGSGSQPSSRFAASIRKHVGPDSSPRAESGAAMVEMAFIFGILVMLLVGVVTSAIAFGQKNQIENAAREASRFAATLAPDPITGIDNAWLEAVRNVAQEAAQGNLDAGVEGQHICVAHFGSSGWQRLRQDDGGAPVPGTEPCYSDGLSDPRVQVETGRDTEINAAFFSVDISLVAPATARYERVE
jgi:Flp pilus assembly pilin Flp